MTDRDTLARQLEEAFANRALLYWEIYRAFAKELGSERAATVLGAAIERRGAAAGKILFRKLESRTPRTVADAFLAVSPDGGRLFPHDRIDEADGGVRIEVHRCPLLEAWRSAGLSAEDQALMCRIAGKFDNGCFGAAGIGFAARTWEPDADGCCRLHLKPSA